MVNKPRVLISAYACEPNKGSEPEVGWRVINEMAKYCRVVVLTRANNKASIEAEVNQLEGKDIEFIYYDLPKFFLFLKKKLRAVGSYYILWQIVIRWHYRFLHKEVDLIHHATFNGVQFPGFWLASKKPIVLGPLGGGMTCPKPYVKLFGKSSWKEKLRTKLIQVLPCLPQWRWSMLNAKTVVAANYETCELIQKHIGGNIELMLETAVSSDVWQDSQEKTYTDDQGPLKLLWLGNLIPRKAAILAVKAVEHAIKQSRNIELWVAGDGPEMGNLKKEVDSSGMAEHIKLLGRVPKKEVNDLMAKADAFLFTSIRDTSGNVVLEAMSQGTPVIVLNHQGVRMICDSSNALLVDIGSVPQTIAGMSNAIGKLIDNPELKSRLGIAGKKHVQENLNWANYGEQMWGIYQKALDPK